MAAAAFTIGIAAAEQFHMTGMVLALSWVLCAAACVLWFKKRRMAAVFLCFLMAGNTVMTMELIRRDPLTALEGRQISFEGMVLSSKVKEDMISVELKEKRGSKMLLQIIGTMETSPECGRRMIGRCQMRRPDPARNPGGFHYQNYLRSRDIHMIGSAKSFQVEQGAILSAWRHRLWRWQQEWIRCIGCVAGEQELGVLQAMVFGDKSALDDELYETFQQNGTAHILAVSGLHIGMVYAMLCAVLGGRRRYTTNAVIAACLLLYTGLAGGSPSVVRAVLMILLHMIARLSHYRYDLMTAAAVAAGILLADQPFQLFSTGFQMSFLAVCSMAVLMPLFQHLPIPAVVRNTILPVFVIQAGMAPYSAYRFHYFSLGAFAANLPVVFLAGFLVPVGVASILLVQLMPPLNGFLSAFLHAGTRMMMDINRFFYAGGKTSLTVCAPPLFLILLYYGILFFFCSEWVRVQWIRKHFKPVFAGLAGVMLMIVLFHGAWNDGFRNADIVFVDVGQGSCVHIRTPAGKNILMDGGGKDNTNIGKKVLRPYLLHSGCRMVDLALATHLDTDHYKGLKELKQEGMIRYLRTNHDGYVAGDTVYEEPHFCIDVLAPMPEQEEERPSDKGENECSLVFRVRGPGYTLLVTGDIGEETERKIVRYWENTDAMQSDLLAVPHHGSKYSSSKELLQAVSPSIAAIQVGKNTYGHPSGEALERLKTSHATIFRNDLHGAVGIFPDNNQFRVRTILHPD